MINTTTSNELLLEPVDNKRLSNLCGPFDKHLRQVERFLGVEINNRGNNFYVSGNPKSIAMTENLLKEMYAATEKEPLSSEHIHLYLKSLDISDEINSEIMDEISIKTKRGLIRGRTNNQKQYLLNIKNHDVNFGIGPAGTGKTYLAVACAVAAMEQDIARRLVLVRPAVEAGEKLGFLPGDLVQKVDPYLRPLYDALYEMLGFEKVSKLIDRNVIEVAPLAFMRGRTLNEAFIILDEAQNTTIEQMKMFLTRIGFNSTAVITGDITQIDLPPGKISGLKHVIDILNNEDKISFTFFKSKDVVRHALVARILNAYEKYDSNQKK
ncbi:MAG: phosphate starvation-inducible protein PhoH [Legionellales bacterium]|nr:phosphate starvation-inducible protein PhoH [Legionellales bacterium]